MTFLSFIAIGAGAAMGAWLRWGLGLWLTPMWLPQIPLGTLVANLVGGYLIGLSAEFFQLHAGLAPELRLLIITGFLGGLTTFSTFSSETVKLLVNGQYAWGFAIITMHLCGSVLLTIAGIYTMKWLHQ